MSRAKTRIAALAAVMLLIFSAAAGSLRVRAAQVSFIDKLEAADVGSDSGTSSFAVMGAHTAKTGLKGAVYENGAEIHLKRDASDGLSYAWADYKTDKKYARFVTYVDILKESKNTQDYTIVLQLVENGTKKTTMTLDPRREYPVRIEADISNAETVRIYVADTKPEVGDIYIALGNAAFLEDAADTIPAPSSSETTTTTTTTTTASTGSTTTTATTGTGSDATSSSTSATSTTASTAASESETLKEKAVSYKGHKYLYVEQNMSWDEAKTWCEVQGGYLATITSEDENNFIAGYLNEQIKKEAYFGMAYKNSAFEWANGEDVTYSNWANRQPDVTGTYTVYGKFSVGAADWSGGRAEARPLGFIIEWGDKQPLPVGDGDMASSNSKAVIILPGMGGSVLTDANGKIVWNGEGEPPALKSNTAAVSGTDASGKTGVIASQKREQNPLYDELISGIEAVCSASDVELFQWDWRDSTAAAVKELSTFITRHGWKQVTLVGHDVGGLVACKYYVGNKEKVEKVITLGTPFYGSVRAAYETSTGVFCDGLSNSAGKKYDVVSTFPLLKNIMPSNKTDRFLGTVGMTGALSSYYDNSAAGTRLSGSGSECIALYDFYDSLKDEEKNPLFVIASTGVPTLNGLSLSQDGTYIDSVYATLEGDGSTLISSAAPDFGTKRLPYIMTGVDSSQLINDETAVTLVGNIIKGLGDTGSYNAGCTDKVERKAPEIKDTLYKITATGNCNLSLTSDGVSMTLNNGDWSLNGTGRAGYICAKSTKTIFTTDNTALLSCEASGGEMKVEVSSSKGAYSSWHSLKPPKGVLFTALPVSRTLTVASDPSNSLVSEIKADVWTGAKEEVPDEPEGKGYKPTWYDLGAIGCFSAAAALCFIGIPACAFGLTRIEMKKRKAMKKRMRMLKRAQQNAALTGLPIMMTPPVMQDIYTVPMYPPQDMGYSEQPPYDGTQQ